MSVLRGLQSAHPTSPVEMLRCGTRLPGGGSYVRVLLCVSCVPASCVHIGLFPVLVRCDYQLIRAQLCLSRYLGFTCVFIVLSVQFDFVWSTRYSRCFLSVSLAMSSPDVLLNTIIWVYVLVCVSLFLPAVCTVTYTKNNAVNNIYNYSKINIPLYGIHEMLVMRKVL